MPSTFDPVKANERVILMDALRGFALLGIFIANVPGFNFLPSGGHTGPYFTAWDKQVEFLNVMLIEGKFYSIFSLLFGWGIGVQMQRREEKSLTPAPFIRRRLAFLLLLGLAHILFLWVGDIVALYAMLGFLLVAVRKWKDRTLLILAITLILSPILLYYIKMQFPWARAPQEFLRETGIALDKKFTGANSEEEWLAFARTMSYPELIITNISGFFFRYSYLFFTSRFVKVFGLFLIGFYLAKNGRYKKLIQNNGLLAKLALAGLVLGLTLNYFMAVIGEKNRQAYFSHQIQGWHITVLYAFGVVPLAIGYISLFFLMAKSAAGRFIVRLLHPLGKMAFTTYIMQSLIATLVFLPFGLNMMGKVGAFYGFVFAVTVFILQLIFSRIWLRYFQFGPIEWLWRSATYGKWQKMKKPKAGIEEDAEKPEIIVS